MKKLLTLFLSLLLLTNLVFTVSANETKIIDEANVLNESEEADLNSLISQFIEKTNFDIVVYFTYDNEYYQKYDSYYALTYLADDTYDNNGYGIGEENDGLIMVVDVYQRDYTITTCGSKCIDTYTDYALNNMYEKITNYLANDEWSNSAKMFVKAAYDVYQNYDYYHSYSDVDYDIPEKQSNPVEDAVTFALIGAGIITLIAFIIFAKQLKTTGVKTSANNYVSGANINIFRSGEIYLYTSVSRTRIERNNGGSHSSHSSTHHSSSGVSHGGGGSHRF